MQKPSDIISVNHPNQQHIPQMGDKGKEPREEEADARSTKNRLQKEIISEATTLPSL